jgi:hypothetical protein
VATIDQPDDLTASLLAAPQSADDLRLAQLRYFSDLSAAERAGHELEQKRLAAKYGDGSPQALAASARLVCLDRMQAALTAELERAAMPVPSSSADRFIVFGRVLSATGEAVAGAKTVAVDATGTTLATAPVGERGVFTLVLPVTKPAPGGTLDHAPPTQPTGPFRVQVTGPKERLLVQSDEELDAVGDRIAYREIIVPKSALPSA